MLGLLLAGVLTVSPDGLSPHEALARIRAAKAAGDTSAWTVKVLPGTYRLSEPLVMTPADSGTTSARVTWEGTDGESVFSGGQRITGWRKDSDGSWSAPIPKGRDGKSAYFEMLWVDGHRARRASYPKDGCLSPAAVSKKDELADVVFTNDAFRAVLAKTSAKDLPYMHMTVRQIWGFDRTVPTGIDAKRCSLTAPAPQPWGSWKTWNNASRMVFENVRAAFSEPGEWFYDAAAGRIRYRPRAGEDMARIEVVAPTPGLSRLLVLEGDPERTNVVHDLVFRGLTFAYADTPQAEERHGPSTIDARQAAVQVSSGAVFFRGAHHITIDRCTVRGTGGYGFRIGDGCQWIGIGNSRFIDLGSGGLWVGSDKPHAEPGRELGRRVIQPLSPLATHHVFVSYCEVTDGGHFNLEGVGINFTHVSDSAIRYCEVHDFGYSGVNCGWTWGYAGSPSQRNEISFNRIRDVGRGELDDMGGIYLLGTAYGTCVSNNVIVNVRSHDGVAGWGLYTDEGSEGVVMENNLVVNPDDGGFHQNYGVDNLIRNNIIVCGRGGGVICSRDVMKEVRNSFTFVNNIVVAGQGCPHVTPYGARPFGVWANNVWWSSGGKGVFDRGDWKAWQATGREVNSIFADPLFVDAAGGDYRLRPGSPALKLGFRPWDFARIGMPGKECR